MKTIFFLSFILFTQLLFSQEVLQGSQIYFDHNIAYRNYDVSVFSGIAEYRDEKGILGRRDVYENGIMTKRTMYYTTNIPKGKELSSQETVYVNRKPITRINYTLIGEKYEYIEYEEDGNRKYSEYWKNGKHTKQYFKNGKLNGIAVTIEKSGDQVEEFYKNGELLKVVKTPVSKLNKTENSENDADSENTENKS